MNNTLTLWQLLNQRQVVIPMVQRDYAQGRPEKEHIRRPFLNEVCQHLESGAPLTLDFVYGNIENGHFLPLDGQQRLTTLWLIHWYVAFRLGKLKRAKKAKEPQPADILLQFSYQTRTSSTDFCEMLCNKMSETDPEEIDNVANYIKNQSWFFTDWLQDPTVDAMLRTLGGDPNSSADSHIQGVFRKEKMALYWENLTQNNTITFELMIIGSEKLPISDDLYIKMNARGKKLTDFENFKADWTSYMKEHPDFSEEKDGGTLDEYYARQIDTSWTYVFWNSREKTEKFDGNIDKIFFSFINRFALNYHCLLDSVPTHYVAKKYTSTDDKIIGLQKKFEALYGIGLGKNKKVNDDSLIEYKDFTIYQDSLTYEAMEKLEKIFAALQDREDITRKLNFSGLDEDEDAEETSDNDLSYHFLPQYDDETGLVPTKLKERLYFHAICLFLESPNWEQLDNWTRVVRNLVENAAVDNIEAMITCLQLIDHLGNHLQRHDWQVLEQLGRLDTAYFPNATSMLGMQWAEELKKAAKLQETPDLKPELEKAENFHLCKGTIRFLYTGPDGAEDWDHFAAKTENMRELFPDEQSKPVSEDTILQFLEQFASFEEMHEVSEGQSYFFTTRTYHNRNNCWKKNILCNPALQKQVHQFLLLEPTRVTCTKYQAFLDSGAVKAILAMPHNYNYRYRDSKGWGVHRDYSPIEGIYTSDDRLAKNRILLALQEEGLLRLNQVPELLNDFLHGKEIGLVYKGKTYHWCVQDQKNWIYLADNPRHRFEWTDDLDRTTLLEKLDAM